jgi:hypothetical protein
MVNTTATNHHDFTAGFDDRLKNSDTRSITKRLCDITAISFISFCHYYWHVNLQIAHASNAPHATITTIYHQRDCRLVHGGRDEQRICLVHEPSHNNTELQLESYNAKQ